MLLVLLSPGACDNNMMRATAGCSVKGSAMHGAWVDGVGSELRMARCRLATHRGSALRVSRAARCNLDACDLDANAGVGLWCGPTQFICLCGLVQPCDVSLEM